MTCIQNHDYWAKHKILTNNDIHSPRKTFCQKSRAVQQWKKLRG